MSFMFLVDGRQKELAPLRGSLCAELSDGRMIQQCDGPHSTLDPDLTWKISAAVHGGVDVSDLAAAFTATGSTPPATARAVVAPGTPFDEQVRSVIAPWCEVVPVTLTGGIDGQAGYTISWNPWPVGDGEVTEYIEVGGDWPDASTEESDLAEAAIDLQMQQLNYQAALAVSAQALQTSLLDYLR